MTATENYLAIDYGAESGRAVLGRFDGKRIAMEEVHRFPNGPVTVGARMHWDVLRLFEELKRGLALGAKAAGGAIRSAGVDTWGVDFALLDSAGDLVANPVHYRDSRTDGILEEGFEIVPREKIFAATGLQFIQFNTLFQLLAMRRQNPTSLDAADRLLMMPDLFNYWLTGHVVNEYTNATTTQCYDPSLGGWSTALLEAFEIPGRLFGEIVAPGTMLGPLAPDIASEVGANFDIALPATHDTGSAVAAVPAEGGSWAYISCGTWSLIGAETREPIISDKALELNFTNEGGVFGTNRLLRNVMGLWLLQGARKAWASGGRELSYAEIARAAEAAPAFAAWLDPDDPGFLNPPDMLEAIAAFCKRSGQRPPESIGATARCIIESLAMKYCAKIEALEQLIGRRIEAIHIVGGGSRNVLLCQATADACDRPVIAGPAEATALGNLLVQATASGSLGGLDEMRRVVRESSALRTYDPREPGRYDEPYARFISSGAG